MPTLISRSTLDKFREFLSDCSDLRTIAEDFDAADIRCCTDYQPEISGMRRTLVEQYYAALDLTTWEGTSKLLRAFENVLSRYEEAAPDRVRKLVQSLEREGVVYRDGHLTPTAGTGALPQVKALAYQSEILAPRVALAFMGWGGALCGSCEHIHRDGRTCAAFPEGIPTRYLVGSDRHLRPAAGDGGITYRPYTGDGWSDWERFV